MLTVRPSGYVTRSTLTVKMRPWNTTFFCARMSLIVFRKYLVEDCLQVRRKRRFELHFPSVGRVMEHQPEGVQKRTVEAEQRPQVAHHPASQAAIGGVSHDGVSDFAEMDADLVRPAGGNCHMDERHAGQVKRFGHARGGGPGAPCR